MGLDQYLHAKKYVSKTEWNNPAENETYDKIAENVIPTTLMALMHETMDYQSVEVSVKVAQWRKSNQIHNWFVKNVQDGEDDCKEYYVAHERLSELLEKCISVTKDNTLASDLLPCTSGFFFGSEEYNEWYFRDIKITSEVLSRLLSDPELSTWTFTYSSSW